MVERSASATYWVTRPATKVPVLAKGPESQASSAVPDCCVLIRSISVPSTEAKSGGTVLVPLPNSAVASVSA